MGAVERYMLADLSVSEVEEFERHFFDCPQCSEELRILSVLRENARAVFIEQHSAPSLSGISVSDRPVTQPKAGRAGWRIRWSPLFARTFAPALAMLALAVFLGYEIGERRTTEPQSVNAYPLYAASRGAETVIAPPAGAQFFTLYMDRTWDRDFASYRAVVHDDRAGSAPGSEQGIERVSMPLTAPLPGRAIQVLFPARALASGRYILTILGKDGSGQEVNVADYSFTLRFQ
jgi:hypothetical protein